MSGIHDPPVPVEASMLSLRTLVSHTSRHGAALPKEYEHLAQPRTVWVLHGDGRWYAGLSLGRWRWTGRQWQRYEVEYATESGETHHRSVWVSHVCSRGPMAEPEKDAPCARCGTSREDCDRREQAEWPPYCCPRCWRSTEKYALHVHRR